MSSLTETLSKLAGDFGHVISTVTDNTVSDLKGGKRMGGMAALVELRVRILELVRRVRSLREPFYVLDTEMGTKGVEKIDTIVRFLKSNEIGEDSLPIAYVPIIDLAISHVKSGRLSEAVKLINNWRIKSPLISDMMFELYMIPEKIREKQPRNSIVEILDTGIVRYVNRVFVSYALTSENQKLVKETLVPLLQEFGFDVTFAPDFFRPDLTPAQNAKELISRSGILIALLTKEKGKLPSQNVIHEIGLAVGRPTVALCEIGVEVPSNITTSLTYKTFSKEEIGRLIFSTVSALKSLKLIEIKPSFEKLEK